MIYQVIKKTNQGLLQFLLILFISSCTDVQKQAAYIDTIFLQDQAEKYELQDSDSTAALYQVSSDRNGNIKILSSKGLSHPYSGKLVKDMQYTHIRDQNIVSIASHMGQFVYLSDEAVFSNAWAGKFYFLHNMDNPNQFCMGENFSVLISGMNKLAYFENSELKWEGSIDLPETLRIMFNEKEKEFLILSKEGIYSFNPVNNELLKRYKGNNLTSISLGKQGSELIVGTIDGVYILDRQSFQEKAPVNRKLPCTTITWIEEINGELWFGSPHGAFCLRQDGKYNYYASRRWLVDDKVTDISKGPENSVLVLTDKGLSKINFVEMTLAKKAAYFQKIQRLRHIRYGFSSETNLIVSGDPSSAVLRDTDNDGLWTSMYLAGELFHYAVTESDDALQNAYEAFEAMERLTDITGLDGFPARTYEIDAYQSSDTDPNIPEDQKIWRLTDDKRWRWKSTTSSDESCGHFFVYALFAEIVPDQEWKERAIHQIKIQMDHIIRNDWYLVTWNGEITQWGRWNPEYVNSFPVSVGDRRLNSTLIIAFLQTAYHFTGEEIYKKKAYELMNEHGYLDNILRPATVIGFVEGEILSDRWNHSDDEMYFLTTPALVKYAFTEELKQKYIETIRTHWEIERSEKNPLWNFLYTYSTGGESDLDESVWWLKEFPMDLVSWKVQNNHRQDLTRIEPNFRRQEYTEVLPPDERPMHLHNNAYRNNGGSDGMREYPPYIYLLPYWLGRYIEVIKPI